MGTSSSPFTDDLVMKNEVLHDTLKEIFKGEDYYLLGCSVVVSCADPGSADQQWHVDGGHVDGENHLPCHCLNVFIPLVDLEPSLGPTEVRPGTHVYSRDMSKMMLGAKARKELKTPVAPLLKKGDALLFDYRVLHRGKANVSETDDRPMLVLTYAKTWFKDVFNFPNRSLEDEGIKVDIYNESGGGVESFREWFDEENWKKAKKRFLVFGARCSGDENLGAEIRRMREEYGGRIRSVGGEEDVVQIEGMKCVFTARDLGEHLGMDSDGVAGWCRKKKFARVFVTGEGGKDEEEGGVMGCKFTTWWVGDRRVIEVGAGWTKFQEEGGKERIIFVDKTCNRKEKK